MNCAEVEILLCEYVDGTLGREQKSALDSHLTACSGCAGLLRDITGAVQFIERTAIVDPPPELLTRILHEIPAGPRIGWPRRILGSWLGGLFDSILQPRYVMGAAMTIVSFSMIARFTGIEPRQLHPSDLDPVKIWTAVDDRAHRVWDRTVKSYENLRWVIEIQSRLKEWSDQDQEAQRQQTQKTGTTGAEPVPKQAK